MNAEVAKARARFLETSRWFDPGWYQSLCPADVSDPLAHYLEHGVYAGVGPNRYIDGLRSSTGATSNPPPANDDTDPCVQLGHETDLIRASGMFDADYYLGSNPDIAAKRIDPLRHFCQYGWRQLRKPCRNFDVWWYWSCHLDPAQDVINPLVHYVLVGQAAGLPSRPPAYAPGPGQVLARGAQVRRICLLAGYDPDGVIDDYVIELARELSHFADVFYFGDCIMRDGQLERLDPWVSGRWARRHGTYDFGSWSALISEHVGWETIARYDELLLVNDSGYLVRDLGPIFGKMQAKECDWWGLQATKGMFATRHLTANCFEQPVPLEKVRDNLIDGFRDEAIYDFHVGSYFLAFRKPVIQDTGFRRRLAAVRRERTKHRLIRKHEIGLTQYLISRQYAFDTYIHDLYPLHPIFSNHHFDLIARGFPLFKRLFLVTNHYDVPGLADWKSKLLAVVPDAPVRMIEDNLLRVANHEALRRSFAIVEKDGQPVVPAILGTKAFGVADAGLPKFDHWWAFVVDPCTGALGGDERAVFEAVRVDPSIKKIILTRWRRMRLEGENIVVASLRSPEGQYHLLRARQVFAGRDPKRSLVYPLASRVRNVIAFGGSRRPAHGRRHCVVVESKLPRWDLVVLDRERLPSDLRAEFDHLQVLRRNRRLVLLAPELAEGPDAAQQRFMADGAEPLHAWLRGHGAVLGVRERMAGSALGWYDALRGPDTLDLSERRFSLIEILMRAADVLVSDEADCISSFVPTGRPVIGLGANVKNHAGPADGGGYDLELPNPVCHSLQQLIVALDAAFECLPPVEGARRCEGAAVGRLSDKIAFGNGARVARNIRTRYAPGVPDTAGVS